MIITIDGPAGSGKGTIAAALAQKYNLVHFDTGMIYRAVGLQMVLDKEDLNDEEKAASIASSLTFAKMSELAKHPDFRSDIGGRAASVVSAQPRVRAALLAMQQNFAKVPVFPDGTPAAGVVYDGRDTGTVVCPQADLKLFVTADLAVRARRRCNDYLAQGIDTSYDKVYSEMKSRDERDRNRSTAPLKPAEDAITVDTSEFQLEDSMKVIVPLVESRL